MAIIPQIITEDRASGAQVIDGSLRFDSIKKQYLTRTPSSAGNQKTFTLSGWFKLSSITVSREFFVSGTDNTERTRLLFQPSDAINFYNRTGNTVHDDEASTALFRDTSSFYHVVISIDNANTTGTFYVNGESVHTFTTVNTNSYFNSTTTHYIGGQVYNDNNYYNGYISQLYLIDGQALDPSYFGYTDPLTNTWKPKKFKSSINNGTTWSNDLTTANPDSGFRSGFPATWAFDGKLSGGATTEASAAGCQIVWSPTQFPASNGPYTLEVLCTGTAASNGGWDFRLLKVNGTTVFDPSVDTPPSSGFVTVSNLTEITEVIVERDATSGRSKLDMIRVNGVPLIDGATNDFGVNGFYLPFDGNTPIGKDQSGNNNDWTPVNFGGYNSIEKATGALPILNTVNGGTTATATVREDANASNLIFALPLAGDITEVTPRINNARTALSFTDAGSTDTVVRHFYGGSRNFDGSNDFLKASIPDGDGLHLQQSSWTVECWFRADVLPGGNDVYLGGVRVDTSSNANTSWNLRIFNNVIEGLWVTGSTQYKIVSPYAITATKWTHVAYVRDGNEQRLYQDGVLVATTSHTTTPNLNNSSFLEIGGRTGSGFFNGKIQDFRIYNNLAKYTGDFIPAAFVPDIRPDTPSGVAYGSELKQITEGSVNGGVSNGDTLLVGNSSDFNFGSGDFTVELFAYHTSTAGNDTLVGMWNSGANRRTWMIDIEADQGRLRGYWSTDGSAVSNVQTATNYIARRRWNHIVFCRQGNTMRLYLNGNQEATATESGSLYNNTDDSLGILSATDAGNDPCRGHISNVRILKGTCLYPDGTSFTPPSAPLTNVTNTVLLGCQSPTNPAEFQVGAAGTTYTTEGSVSPSAYSNQLYRLFDNDNGTFWGHTSTNSNSGYVTYTFPGSGIPFTQLEIAGSNYNSLSVKVNGVEFTNWGTNYTSPPWHDITSSVTSPLTSVSVYGNGSGQTSTMSRIRINGSSILVDAVTVKESVSASTFNPFTDDINTVRGQENAYCTLNAAATYNGDGGDIQDGGLKFECPASGDASTRGTIPIPAGSKFYMEARYRVVLGSGGQARLGIAQVQQGYTKSGTGMWSIDYRGSAGTVQKDDEGTVTTLTGNPDQNDIVGIKIDLATGEFRAHHRGIYYNGGNALMTGIPNVESYFFAALDGGVNRNDWDDINFGQKPWEYPPGDGYEPLCSANLPRLTEAAVRPDKYFNTMVWSGDDTTRSMTGLGFRPDLVWIKCRTLGAFHNFTDSVRGPKVIIQSNTVTAEQKPTTHNGAIDSFDPDGFTLGTGLSYGDVNQSGRDYVGWAWKGGTPENYTTPCGSVLFDGTGDYLSLPVSSDFQFGSGDFTIECWAKAFDQGTDDILGILNTGSNRRTFCLRKDQTESVQFLYSANGSSGTSVSSSAGAIKLGTWHHYAVVRDNYVYRIYLDGVLVATDSSSTDAIYTNNDDGLRIGSSYNTDFDGQISNVRIVKGTALYTSNFTPSSAPLTNVTNTKLLCCQSATSASAAAVAPGSITANGNATPTTHNPFDNYRVDGRVYATAAEAGLTAGTKASLLTGASVNTDSGFSILTWTGDGTNSNLQIPHGLSTRPKMVVIKKRNEAVDHWYVAHDGIQGNNYAYRMFWGPTKGGNLPDGSTTTTDPYYLATQSSNDTLFLNNTTTNGGGNEDNIAYVGYCWSEVPGFSKFGTYTGNGAVNGPLIECGFRPAWVMVKVAGGSTGNSWTLWDNKRDTHNEMNLYLHPNEAQQDGTYVDIKMDFYANGFKPRGNIVHQNTSGIKYIYAAFADVPTSNLYGAQANAR